MALKLKLGKLAPKQHERTLFFRNYHVAVPPAPPECYYNLRLHPSDWKMMGNDSVGDCAIAAPAHQAFLSNSYTDAIANPTLDDVLNAYSAVSGYVRGDESTDNGCAMTDVWNYTSTVGIGQYKIAGWVQIDHTNLEHVRQAIYVFGGIQIGVQLPNSAMDQFNADEDWTVVANDGGIAGGHAIYGCGYPPTGDSIAIVSWGRALHASLDWLARYVDEMYAIVSLDWLAKSGVSPSHLNLAALKQDLLSLQQ